MTEFVAQEYPPVTVDYDQVLQDSYGCGMFQVLLLFALSAGTLFTSMEFASINFMSEEIGFVCDSEHNVSWITQQSYRSLLNGESVDPVPSVEQCWGLIQGDPKRPFKCMDYVFQTNSSGMSNSLVSEFQLVCDLKPLVLYQELTFTFCLATGHLIMGFLERFGRRRVYILVMAGIFLTQIGMTLIHSLWTMFLMRALRGLFDTTYLGICILCEVLPTSKRMIYVNFLWIFYGIGYILTALFAYVTRDWRQLRMCMLLPIIMLPMIFYVVVESPRWLMLRGRHVQAMLNLRKIARINRVRLPRNYFRRMDKNCTIDVPMLDSPPNDNAISLMLIYFASTTDDRFASTNVFLNMVLQGLLEFPSTFLAWILSEKAGRRMAVSSLLLLASILLGGVSILKWFYEMGIFYSLLACMGKFAVTTAYGVNDVYATELLPTSIRCSALFIIITVAFYGMLIGQVVNKYDYIACIVYAVLSLIATILCFFRLPETAHLDLPDTIDQASQLKRGQERHWHKIELSH
ncbi:hypothetical protein Ciccas_010127 [Cichlidogyrus casuarinus]|uniref:Major facilitator superfamily (MFS) profile domain-containing protein n=1 Tax=Cichlidogyrus casuarinus TaxID=1844966 RepID=A0ABD2PV03_9PLAT